MKVFRSNQDELEKSQTSKQDENNQTSESAIDSDCTESINNSKIDKTGLKAELDEA